MHIIDNDGPFFFSFNRAGKVALKANAIYLTTFMLDRSEDNLNLTTVAALEGDKRFNDLEGVIGRVAVIDFIKRFMDHTKLKSDPDHYAMVELVVESMMEFIDLEKGKNTIPGHKHINSSTAFNGPEAFQCEAGEKKES